MKRKVDSIMEPASEGTRKVKYTVYHAGNHAKFDRKSFSLIEPFIVGSGSVDVNTGDDVDNFKEAFLSKNRSDFPGYSELKLSIYIKREAADGNSVLQNCLGEIPNGRLIVLIQPPTQHGTPGALAIQAPPILVVYTVKIGNLITNSRCEFEIGSTILQFKDFVFSRCVEGIRAFNASVVFGNHLIVFDTNRNQMNDNDHIPQSNTETSLSVVVPATAVWENMYAFFDQDIAVLTVDGMRHMNVVPMRWFDTEISSVVWRPCYSYILCSIIAFFNNALQTYTEETNIPRKKKSMVLTGIQGTGKSILGAIIALCFGKGFGWKVNYFWQKQKYTYGTATTKAKEIHIVDLRYDEPDIPRGGFVLVVSSANADRWQTIGQQQTWGTAEGNFCFIDVAARWEIEAMCRNDEQKKRAQYAYEYIGGVPRLCLSTQLNEKEKIDSTLSQYSIGTAMKNLSSLQDSFEPGKKQYPGIICHAIPTNKFRNEFKLEFGSVYIATQVEDIEKNKEDQQVQKLLQSMLETPKARSCAGWIWESLFTRKVSNDDSRIAIASCELPVVKSSSVEIVLSMETSNISTFTFEDMEDFVEKAKATIQETGDADFVAFGKAKSQTFEAFDGVFLIRKRASLTIAALQLTVAEKKHSVLQSMILNFCLSCEKVDDSSEAQLWFLQPEESLSYFNFTHLQAMKFDEETPPRQIEQTGQTGKESILRRSRRKRQRTSLYGNIAENERIESNDRAYWNERICDLKQFVGIVQIDAVHTVRRTVGIKGQFEKKLGNVTKSENELSELKDPTGRSWNATVEVLMEFRTVMGRELFELLCRDLIEDRDSLVSDGITESSLCNIVMRDGEFVLIDG